MTGKLRLVRRRRRGAQERVVIAVRFGADVSAMRGALSDRRPRVPGNDWRSLSERPPFGGLHPLASHSTGARPLWKAWVCRYVARRRHATVFWTREPRFERDCHSRATRLLTSHNYCMSRRVASRVAGGQAETLPDDRRSHLIFVLCTRLVRSSSTLLKVL